MPRRCKVPADTMHVIGVRMFLDYTLGGFDPASRNGPVRGRFLAPGCVRKLRELAEDGGKVPYGRLRELSDRYGCSCGGLAVIVFRARRGIVPRYWRDA